MPEGDHEAERSSESESEDDEATVQEKLRQARAELGDSKEERIAWLRQQGFLVSPGSNVATTIAGAPEAAAPKRPFAYVFLSAKADVPPDVRWTDTSGCETGGSDVLEGLLAAHFGKDSENVSDAVLQQCAQSHGQEVGLSAMRAAIAQGGVDVIPLSKATMKNSEVVSLYMDDCAQLKGLPLNRRASLLARSVGLGEMELIGDIFVGRTRTVDGGVINVDFTLEDLAKVSALNSAAVAQAVDLGQDDNDCDNTPTEESSPLYTWQDCDEDIEITLSAKVSKDQVKLRFARQRVQVVQPFELQLDLFDAVDNDAATWYCCPEGVRITLPKRNTEARWPRLTRR